MPMDKQLKISRSTAPTSMVRLEYRSRKRVRAEDGHADLRLVTEDPALEHHRDGRLVIRLQALAVHPGNAVREDLGDFHFHGDLGDLLPD